MSNAGPFGAPMAGARNLSEEIDTTLSDLLAIPCALFPGEKPCHEVPMWEKCGPCRAISVHLLSRVPINFKGSR